MIGWLRRLILQWQQFRIRRIVKRWKLLPGGTVYHVDCIKGSDSNDGSEDAPFRTIGYALSQCKDSSDDMIVLAGEE